MTVPDSPSFVEVGGGFMQLVAGFVHDVGAFGLGLLLVLLVLAVKAAPLIAFLSVVASALPPAHPRPRRRTGLAYLFALAALLLAYLALPAPPSLVHPNGGDGEDPDGHARIVATLPPAIAADFYDHLVCCDPNRARCGHDVTDIKWTDPDDPAWGPTCPDCAAVEDDDCPHCTTGGTTPANWVTRDETGASS
jgi:hypothetical protein